MVPHRAPAHSWRLAALSTFAGALLLASCSDFPAHPTAPTVAGSGFETLNPAGDPPDAAGIVLCDLAVRNPAGQYRTRKAPVRVPNDLRHPDGVTVSFGFVGWAPGEPDPRRFATCRIPATEEAVEHFKTVFQAGDRSGLPVSLEALSGDSWEYEIRVLDESALLYYGDALYCDPYALIDWGCECPDFSCGGWGTGEGDEIGPAPVDGDVPDGGTTLIGDGGELLIADDGYAMTAPTAISCLGQTHNPHRSTHVPGTVNVIGQTSCTAPVSQSISVTISRQSCWWIFCWWSSRGWGYDGGFKTLARANAAAPCQTGWWRGASRHSVTPPLGYWPPTWSWTTRNTQYVWC
jgi:hypothetical protein